ncbi:hypothetical protein MATR_20070 [Marivirga tractuosa]|uniref:Beta-Ig-H3/fasciclin n=1 Tax=Marivirga tractuosa (strain ATCC 23168 / DSM 4126 / NBRC 15989 / NCIMB 1408 / VKM B-1430 / H-43) TaxID=643867 RepID=E4TMS6_MARTH|nr:beta-Ig-H3/fasciclin [Marivirga tractuosa DSM 4126]BDD15182.1 hypothetical protein MATR_20070 [Marivirga tractuosa]
MKKLNYLIALAFVFTFASCGGGESKTAETDENETTTEEMAVEEMTAEKEATAEEESKDIVALAMETESLSTLVSAVKAGGLVETLQGDGPFTVFAPTNAAFEALPEGTLEDLLKPENKEKLASILTYHVVAGKVMSTDLSDGMKAKTVNGAEVTIKTADGVKVNGANVVTADVKASNGVVHVIDAVIMPPKK